MTLVLSRSVIALLARDTTGTRANKLMPHKPIWLKLCGLILEIRDTPQKGEKRVRLRLGQLQLT